MKLLMKPPLRLCLGDELPSTDPRQCHGAMILPPRRHLWRGPGGVPAPCGWRRVPATTASNRPDLLHRRAGHARQLLAARPTRAAPWTPPGARSVRAPRPAHPRPRCTVGWWARRGLTARGACCAWRAAHAAGTLRGAFYSARPSCGCGAPPPFRSPAAPVSRRRAPGGRTTGSRGRWSPPRPAPRTGPVPRPAALACSLGRSGVLPSH